MIDISLIWIVIIALGIFIYVVLDGFDLGIGILYPFFPNKSERDVMMNTVAPVWDGNETWLVLGGAALYAAFPMVYAIVLSALYLPIIFMVVALIFRGVAFEFRFKATRTKYIWDRAFIGGSVLAGFFQGVILGAYIQGIKVQHGMYSGGGLDWISPFTIFTGIGVVVLYATLGCGWLIFKTELDLQQRMYQRMPKLVITLLFIFGALSIYTSMAHPEVAERWFRQPQLIYFSFVPILVIILTLLLIRACYKRHQLVPFLYTLALVFFAYIGFIISIWPYVIPPSITIWQAAAPLNSQLFTLIGALILIPIILMYTGLSYWVFRDKVRIGDQGYH